MEEQTTEPKPPTGAELTKYMGKLGEVTGIRFDGEVDGGIAQLRTPYQYRWYVRGKFDLIVGNNPLTLNIETHDRDYFNQLRQNMADEDNCMFNPPEDGNCREKDTNFEMFINNGLFSFHGRDNSYRLSKDLSKKGGSITVNRFNMIDDDEIAGLFQKYSSILEEAKEYVFSNYPKSAYLLVYPHKWALENFPNEVIFGEIKNELNRKKSKKQEVIIPVNQLTKQLSKPKRTFSGLLKKVFG
ncbi:MAG: hypothetical protein PHH54_03285 [Candidatus Nanoarchaeia archaeon]|nr:hypothetical protein [Candidatus Nanoarchaeia archaeon]MDD5740980.1 hypothetical protein [Candidatus Nanoarchaeia archaeon]